MHFGSTVRRGWSSSVLLALFFAIVTKSSSFVLIVALGSGKSPIPTVPAATKPDRASWTDRVHQLKEYRLEQGDTLVPKRYEDNPGLANWVSKQRQQYRKFCANETPCSLTEDKIRILENIGFCWDASCKTNSQQDDVWWTCLEELKSYKANNANIPAVLRTFLRDQRKEYWILRQGHQSKLDDSKLAGLAAWDSNWWKTSRELQWDLRYQELEEYLAEHGDCCVPISHHNRQLANWVSNVRKQYNLRASGKHSTLTEEKIDQLKAIGFVWDRWEYEFEVKIEKLS
jgi:hypothetical protein